MQVPQVRAGLFGRPVSKSLSPEIFGIFSRLTGVKMFYSAREVAPGGLRLAITEAKAEGWDGFNITVPFKGEACAMLALPDPAATACGAVNAVRFGRSGLEGMNTDARALIQAFEEAGFNAAGRNSVIFGAGGAAASAGWALGRSSAAAVTFRARNLAAAKALAQRLADTFPKTVFSAAAFEAPTDAADITINATPLGMYEAGLPPCQPRPGALCADMAYAPGGTEFTAAASAAGARVIDGLALLVRQAALSLRFWAGLPTGDIVKFSREAEELLREKLKGE